MTVDEQKQLATEYPEGVPVWIVSRSTTIEEARTFMNLRREAFPVTIERFKR